MSDPLNIIQVFQKKKTKKKQSINWAKITDPFPPINPPSISMASFSSPIPSSSSPSSLKTRKDLQPQNSHLPSSSFAQFSFPSKPKDSSELSIINPLVVPKWRTKVSFFPSFLKKKGKSSEEIKKELFEAIAPLDRGAEATPEDQERIEQIVRELEVANSIKEPLNSDLINGKWELLYTTSSSILQRKRPKILRPNGKIYQAINADTLRAQNMETWPYFNQVTADLTPINASKVAVKFDTFKIAGFIPIKAPDTARGELEITYLDEEIRISRGDKGNLFILKIADPSYRVPL